MQMHLKRIGQKFNLSMNHFKKTGQEFNLSMNHFKKTGQKFNLSMNHFKKTGQRFSLSLNHFIIIGLICLINLSMNHFMIINQTYYLNLICQRFMSQNCFVINPECYYLMTGQFIHLLNLLFNSFIARYLNRKHISSIIGIYHFWELRNRSAILIIFMLKHQNLNIQT